MCKIGSNTFTTSIQPPRGLNACSMHHTKHGIKIGFIHLQGKWTTREVERFFQEVVSRSPLLQIGKCDTHEQEFLIILKTPDILRFNDGVPRASVFDVSVYFTSILDIRKLDVKVWFKGSSYTHRLPILCLTKDTNQVILVFVTCFPCECLKYNHPSLCTLRAKILISFTSKCQPL